MLKSVTVNIHRSAYSFPHRQPAYAICKGVRGDARHAPLAYSSGVILWYPRSVRTPATGTKL